MNAEGRPATERPAAITQTIATVTPLTVKVRQAWAARFIRRGAEVGAIPRYGSEAWRLLPDTDPRKVAGCVVAAECWATNLDTLEERLHDEIAAARQVQEDIDAEGWAIAAERVRRTANQKTWAQIEAGWSA